MNDLQKSASRRRFLIAALLLAALILLDLAVDLLPFRAAYPDVSGSNAYRLSDTSKRYLSGLTEDVEIVYYTAGGREGADKDLYPFLLQYADASPRVTVTLKDIAGTDAAEQSIEIRSARRTRVLRASDLFYYYNSGTGMTLSVAEYAQALQTISDAKDTDAYQALMTLYAPSSMTAYFSGDPNLTGAIRFVLADSAPVLCIYSKGVGFNQLLRQELEQGGCSLRELRELPAVPEDCDVLLLSVSEDLTEAEASALSDYLARGGAVFLNTTYDAVQIPQLSAVLSAYGLSAPSEPNLLYDGSSQAFNAVIGDHPVTDRFNGKFVALYAHAIQTTATEGVTQTVLLRTSENAYKVTSSGSDPEKGSFPLCVAAESGDSKLVWLSMTLNSLSNAYSSGANFAFTERVLGWMTDTSVSAVSTPASAIPSSNINVSTTGFVIWIVAFVVLIPLALLIVGGTRAYLRKKRS